jgi:ubiquinone biosynthesis protein UbiJ
MNARRLEERLLAHLGYAIARLLEFDPDTAKALAALEGRVVAIEIEGIARRLFLVPGNHGLSMRFEHADTPQVRMRGTVSDFLTLARSRLRNEPIPAGTIEIIGDLSTAQHVQDIVNRLDIDWEEMLAHLLGDTAARKLGNLVRDLGAWLRTSQQSMELNVSEYVHFETEVVPEREAVDAFMQNVDTLRADSDRLAERVKRLQSLLNAEVRQ